MNLPLDILRFILLFNNEYRIICNRFLNIKKLTNIRRPKIFGLTQLYTINLVISNKKLKYYQLEFSIMNQYVYFFLVKMYVNDKCCLHEWCGNGDSSDSKL